MNEMKKPEQESFYEVHVNKDDELMISIHARDSEPSSPVILYDGGAHALLYRTPDSVVLLDFLHPAVRECLKAAKSVLMAEVRQGDVFREYAVPCRFVKNLPLDLSAVKPMLDRKDAAKLDERNLYK